eukprot:1157491-Pelagomonas_calceolata.AAC.6
MELMSRMRPSSTLFPPTLLSPCLAGTHVKTEPGLAPGHGGDGEDEATSGPPPTRWRWLLLSFVFPAHAVRGPPLQAAQVTKRGEETVGPCRAKPGCLHQGRLKGSSAAWMMQCTVL